MAKFYMGNQLVATSDAPGLVGQSLRDAPMRVVFDYHVDQHYTIIVYDDNDIHLLRINVINDTLGDILVNDKPFNIYLFNYDVIVYIYQQPHELPIPADDFDMEDFVKFHQLQLMYRLEFLVLQKIEVKPNLFSNRIFNEKIKKLKLKQHG